MAFICSKPSGECPRCGHFRPDPDRGGKPSCFAELDMRPPEITAEVLQRPYAVRIECSHCGHEWETPYADFCEQKGQPPDWDTVDCPACGRRLRIGSQDWS